MFSQPASTKPYKPASDVFHSVEIEGFHFSGVVRNSDPTLVSGGWVQLGPQSVVCQTPSGMQVCKYRAAEERIHLGGLSAVGVERLCREFGLERGFGAGSSFASSPAFAGLVAWAEKHPRKAAKLSPNYRLGPWRETPAQARGVGGVRG